MDNPTKFIEGQDGGQESSVEKAWNDPGAFPETHFNPVTDQFEQVSESPENGDAGQKASGIKDKVGEATGTVQEKTHELTGQAHTMTDKGIDSAAAGIGQAASMLRQQGDAHEGSLGTAASKTADTLEQASTYLQDKDTDQFVSDIEAMVRKRPVESVLVAAGIGYVLSKIFS